MAMKILREVNLSRVLVPSALFGYIVGVEIVKNVITFLLKKGLNVHIMNDHEPPEVIQHFEANWIHNQKHLIKRNYYYAQDRFHSQKWDSAMVL